jgi:sec-independent protein translocase protein TatB
VFDIGWSEMAVILLVALVVIGPRDLPRVARTMGRWVAKGRAMAREFQNALEDMAREAELDKVKSEIEKVGRTNLGKTIENTIDPGGELGKAFDPHANSGTKADRDTPAKPAVTKPAAVKDSRAGSKDHVDEAAAAGAAETAARPIEPAAAKPGAPPPAKPAPPSAGPEKTAARRRPRTRAPKREAVPADPS